MTQVADVVSVPAQRAPADGGDVRNTHAVPRKHPRTIGWFGTASLAMGGSNQSLFLIATGTGLFATQGSATIWLLLIGLAFSVMAAPGWIELILMWPDRVGGIAGTCAEAFRPYSAVLANLTGVCYWWGWVPTCGLTAILSATALHQWYVPGVPVTPLAIGIVCAFVAVNLCGVRWVTRLAMPIAVGSATLAFLSAMVPVWSGHVSWRAAASWHLVSPFHGAFGGFTSAMAGIYLIGFAAPAFEAATCHVGETINPIKNVPRAVWVAAGMAGLYFAVLPTIWLGTIGLGTPSGASGLTSDLGLSSTLWPTFAPLFGSAAKSAAIWVMTLNMFHGTLQPLAGAARTLSQMSEDGLLPRMIAWRNRFDVPFVSTLLTGGMAIAFLIAGDPVSVVAAANLTYLIGIALPSIAVWLLRRHQPNRYRPYRAPKYTIGLGVVAAVGWGLSTVFGFEQFGMRYVVFGLALAYSGSILYAWRVWRDRRQAGLPNHVRSIHMKLTGAMVLVMAFDASGYYLAVRSVSSDANHVVLVTVLQDIFVVVALLTISVGLVLPGMISHAAGQVAESADRLANGTLLDLTRAMEALGDGNLEEATARVDTEPVHVYSKDEIGQMADNFNQMHREIARTAVAMEAAREQLRLSRDHLEELVDERTRELSEAQRELERAEVARRHLLEGTIRSREQVQTMLSATLHDGPIQRLTAVGYALEEGQLVLQLSGTEEAMALFAQARAELADEIAALRRLMSELRPPVLDTMGLHGALRDLLGAVGERTGLATNLTVNLPQRLHTDLETLVYRLVQEALTNIGKHAQASEVSVDVVADEQSLTLTVRDDGVGFDASAVEALVAEGHFGLAGMRERVHLAHGSFFIDSAPDEGTVITAVLPLGGDG